MKVQGQTDVVNSYHFDGNRDRLWLEPIIAMRVKVIASKRIEFFFYTDYGPIRNEDEFTNQYLFGMNFLIGKWFYITPGYRYWLYQSKKEEAIFNGELSGFHIKFGAQF